jgi:hypothetical protein
MNGVHHRLLRSTATVAVGSLLLLAVTPSGAQLISAGGSGAVLSFIDAAAGRVEVVRHWPWASSDVDVYPFVPYAWGGCPGPGAIMMLITGPGTGSSLAVRIARALTMPLLTLNTRPRGLEIMRIGLALQAPGNPAEEALKAAIPVISDLATYERFGYAVFLFIHWQGTYCAVTFKAVPEGYGIPFVE